MKKNIAILAAILVATTAFAANTVQINNPGSNYRNGGGYGGGEFQANPQSGWVGVTGLANDIDGASFQTFCIETGEHLGFGGVYNAVINTDAVDNNGNGPDPVDAMTAFLYANFRKGTLTGYNNTPGSGRANSAQALQEAIWFIEGEAGNYGTGQSFYDLAVEATTLGTDNLITWTGLHGVRALNLTSYENGHLVQNQDVLTIIPAPAAALLGMLGLVALSGLRRIYS